jgi:cytochrome c5
MFGTGGVLVSAMLLFAGDRTLKKSDKAKELFVDVCTSCHTLARVKSQELSKEEWQGRIKGMISEGAALTDEEFSMIVDYLAKNFGTKE